MLWRETLRHAWHRYQDPLRKTLGPGYDQTFDPEQVKARAMESTGGMLLANGDTHTINYGAMNREMNQILTVAQLYGVTPATLSYLADHYDMKGREKVDFDDWRESFWQAARVAGLLRDTMIAMLGEIKPGAAEVLAP